MMSVVVRLSLRLLFYKTKTKPEEKRYEALYENGMSEMHVDQI